MKDFVVLFGDNGARIMKGINPDDWKGNEHGLLNPDLSKVQGIPPHLWKRVGASVVPGDAPPGTQPVTAHTVQLDESFLKGHLKRHHRFGYLINIGISIATSAVVSILFHHFLK